MKSILNLLKRIINKLIRIGKLQLFKLQQIYFYIAGSKVECNICHFRAKRFNSDSWHLYCNCAYCGSGVRQRLLMASFTNLDKFNFQSIISNKKVLHFAPEKALSKIIQSNAGEYKTADFLAEGYKYDKIDYNIDISSMRTIPNESFDCVIACDVLEHVRNHLGGIKEVHRVLKNGGYCIFTVPQKDNLKITLEDLTITDKNERERVFGQFDHMRIYGEDFVSMLEDAGFETTAVNESYFKKSLVERNVLFPPVLSKHPLATNYRKIFFGKKK